MLSDKSNIALQKAFIDLDLVFKFSLFVVSDVTADRVVEEFN